MTLNGKKILLGMTGGVAAYKAAELTRLLVKAGADVRVAMTEAATHFIGTRHHAGPLRPAGVDRSVGSARHRLAWATSSCLATAT